MNYISDTGGALLIRIPKGVSVEEPILLNNLLGSDPAVGDIDIVMEDGSSCRVILCDHAEQPDTVFSVDRKVNISVGRNASLHLYDVEHTSRLCHRQSALSLSQAADSHVLINTLTILNGQTSNSFHCAFAAPGAELQLFGMAVADGEQRVSVYSHIDHAAPHCHSNELFKMTASDQANCTFTGRIHVAEGAVKTEAYQASRNLVIGDKARIQSQPELEIYNDDVKCSHGCAVGQLDETQVFYMRTRGIPEAEARRLLRQAFMAEVINAVALPELKEKLTDLVNDRLK